MAASRGRRLKSARNSATRRCARSGQSAIRTRDSGEKKTYRNKLRSPSPSSHPLNKAAAPAFHARAVHKWSSRYAGTAIKPGKANTCAGNSNCNGVGATGSRRPARSNKDARSAGFRRKASANRASAAGDAETSRPCSSHVIQVTPTPVACANSSRRQPGVRRLPDTSAGNGKRSRWARIKAPSSARGSDSVMVEFIPA